MDESEVNGVFLHSKHLDSEFMVKCLHMLVNNFPEVKITSVVYDELHFGYRVEFSAPNEEVVLARKYLFVSGTNVRIGPLRTSLTIHGVQKNGGEKFEVELRETILNTFGKLLYVIAVSNPENETTKNLRACVDVPEIEELEVFNHDGSPDMFVSLPDNTEKFKVTFHCRRCTQDGHAQQNCPNLSFKEEVAIKTNGSIDSKDFTSDTAKSFQIRLESPNSYAEKIGREEILKTGILSENQNIKEDKPGTSSTSENSTTENFPFVKIKNEFEEPHNHIENSENLQDAKRLTDNFLNSENKDSNSNMDDDEIQVIEVPNSSNSRHSFTLKSESKDEETNSNDGFSSAAKYALQSFSSSPRTVAGPSSRNSATPMKPITAVEVTKILSPQLQACINAACDEFNILDRDQLDAFLIHVKKKSNPLRIASFFTDNAGKLKDLLQRIITLFYNTPEAGTKDDTQFIKWLTGLVERFEGTIPKKRKRCDRSNSPNRK